MELRGRKVTVMGLGCHGGGVTTARYCAQMGAIVTVTDLANETALAESVMALKNVPIAEFVFGKHREVDFSTADIVVVNPAVKPSNRFIKLARQSSSIITSETELFLNACPAKVIGVTGTVGKSTTATMLAEILKSTGRRSWLGGNIGYSLLNDVSQVQTGDVVVLEMSSFQLHWLNEVSRWPEMAIFTNCLPNHLDWHGSWGNYVAAKQRLLSHVPMDGFVVINHHNHELIERQKLCHSAILSLHSVKTLPKLQVLGKHNCLNAAATATAAKELGVSEQLIFDTLAKFRGLPHRLQFVADIGGRRFYNDSKSTTPAATIAALESMEQPSWLLLGGADKQNNFNKLVDVVIKRANGVALFGALAETLRRLFAQTDKHFPCFCSNTLTEALDWSWKQSKSGDAILLSPSCPSTDQYRDYYQRGEEFERLVHTFH